MTASATPREIRLGLGANWRQFAWLVLINAFVGGMVGLERTVLPVLAEADFGLAAKSAATSFIVSFGIAKALTNFFAGRFSDRFGRRPLLIAGWLIGLPVPFLLMWAPDWNWIVFANVLLGVNQGLCWSTTVIMKIDLVGPLRRGLAMGLNEFAGYLAVALVALATGYLAATYGLRPVPFYLGALLAIAGLLASLFFARETAGHARQELRASGLAESRLSLASVFTLTSFRSPSLSAVSQAGLVNNLNDGLAWGVLPLLFLAAGLNLEAIGWIAAIYPATWGLGQLITGALSDRVGRKWPIVTGMWLQGAALLGYIVGQGVVVWALAAALLGIGTALVYPTLIAAVGDAAHPSWRASAVGIYRLWRDLGYAVGALIAGVLADWFGFGWAIGTVAALTVLSGCIVAVRFAEQTHAPLRPQPAVAGSG